MFPSSGIVAFVLMTLFCRSFALLDTLHETLGSLRSYIGDLGPSFLEGVKMMYKAERFVDSALGEECIYECPNRRKQEPLPRPGHVKTSNGCGSMDVIFDDSDESLIHVEKGFTECCDEHDYCYDTCNADKDECDLKFKKCLYRQCKKDQHQLDYLTSKACKLKAKVFFLTLVGVGCSSYLNAQEKACQCVSRRKTEL